MSGSDTAFNGSIPAIYDACMVPPGPNAELAGVRARALNPKRVLETAAGTGALTETLHQSLEDADIVATDLNRPVLANAATPVRNERGLRSPHVPRIP